MPKQPKKMAFLGKSNDEFFKELDQHGPYPLSAEKPGQLTPEALIKLLSVINSQIYTKFAIKKEKLMNRRIQCLKKKKLEEYKRIVNVEQDKEFEKIEYRTKNDALLFLDINREVFDASVEETKNNPQTMEQIEKCEEMAKQESETAREIHESRDVIKKIYAEQIKITFQAGTQLVNQEKEQPLTKAEL